jgi:hypothetical protein
LMVSFRSLTLPVLQFSPQGRSYSRVLQFFPEEKSFSPANQIS